jgi:hypothetical protein
VSRPHATDRTDAAMRHESHEARITVTNADTLFIDAARIILHYWSAKLKYTEPPKAKWDAQNLPRFWIRIIQLSKSPDRA